MIKAEVVSGLKKLSSQFKALGELADNLEEIGSLETAAAEAKKSLFDTNGQIEIANQTLTGLRNEISALSATDAPHKVKARELIEDAEFKADTIIESAKVKAKAQVDMAVVESAKIIERANGDVSGLREECVALETQKSLLSDEISQKQKLLSELEKQLASIRSKFA